MGQITGLNQKCSDFSTYCPGSYIPGFLLKCDDYVSSFKIGLQMLKGGFGPKLNITESGLNIILDGGGGKNCFGKKP